jgi:hypothetical protein
METMALKILLNTNSLIMDMILLDYGLGKLKTSFKLFTGALQLGQVL